MEKKLQQNAVAQFNQGIPEFEKYEVENKQYDVESDLSIQDFENQFHQIVHMDKTFSTNKTDIPPADSKPKRKYQINLAELSFDDDIL